MAIRRSNARPGTVVVLEHTSLILKDNPLGDPYVEGKDDGRIKRFLDRVWRRDKLSSAEVHAIMNVCMAATYDPDAHAPSASASPSTWDPAK